MKKLLFALAMSAMTLNAYSGDVRRACFWADLL